MLFGQKAVQNGVIIIILDVVQCKGHINYYMVRLKSKGETPVAHGTNRKPNKVEVVLQKCNVTSTEMLLIRSHIYKNRTTPHNTKIKKEK